MRLERYGLVLRSMEIADLEMVRRWRNTPHVRENMEYQEEISPAMQQEWFSGLDPERNLYLVAQDGREAFGVLHVKDIDWEERSGEAGIFVGEKGYLGTFLPVNAVLAMMDLAFLGLGMQVLYAKVKADRPQILDFNERLGYAPLPDPPSKGFLRLRCTPGSYRYAAKVLRRQAQVFQRGPGSLEVGEGEFAGRWADLPPAPP